MQNNAVDNPAKLMTASQVARLLEVCPRTVANLRERGELVPVKIGRSVRYKRGDVLQFIDNLPTG